jgi:predicted Zn-dependent protease
MDVRLAQGMVPFSPTIWERTRAKTTDSCGDWGVIALFGVITYFTNVDVNPVTGEKQRVQLSARQEVALGIQARDKMAAQHGGLYPDSRLQAYVDQVGERVVKQSQASEAPYPFQFHLLRDPKTINAFALPGGQVFITAALLNRLNSEAQTGRGIGA